MQRNLFAGVFLSLLLSASAAVAQTGEVEYGRPDELRGVTKVYVDAGLDVQRRESIVKELRKQLPKLEVVSSPAESDTHLRFSVKDIGGGKTAAAGAVVKVVGKDRVRVLYSYTDSTPVVFEGDPLLNSGVEYAKPHIFARQFVKVYKKANG